MTAATACRARPQGHDGKIGRMPTLITLPQIARPIDQARRLDLEADAELQHGHVARAEHLSRRAAELRGVSV